MDTTAFEELFLGHVGRVVRLATLLGAEDPEDVAQESFSKLYAAQGRHRWLQADDAIPYLNRIVVNEVRSRQGKASKGRTRHLHPVDHPGPDEEVIRNDSIVQLMKTLNEISARQREALILRYWLDLRLSEIAEVMQVRVGTVKSLLSRGLDRLAGDLETYR